MDCAFCYHNSLRYIQLRPVNYYNHKNGDIRNIDGRFDLIEVCYNFDLFYISESCMMHLSKMILLMTMGVVAESKNLGRKEHKGQTEILNDNSSDETAFPATIKTKDNRLDRTQFSYGNPKMSCPTKTAFTYLKEAVDVSGDLVKLAPLHQDDGTVVKQLVQESFCGEENCTCRGIKGRKFESTCMTDYMFSGANVIKDGQVVWSHIKIRSGCSCVLKQKYRQNRHHTRNILDMF